MKKNKIITIIFMSILILLAIPVISNATGTFSATISKTTVTEGDTFTVTVTATNAVGEYTVTASNTNAVATTIPDELFLDGYSSSDSQTWTFKANKAGTVTIIAKPTDISDTDENAVTNSKTFEVTIKAKTTSSSGSSSGSSNSSSASSNSSSTGNTASSSSTSGNSNTTGSTSSGNTSTSTNTETAKPTFTSTNKTVYTTGQVNLRSSWSTTSNATTVEKGTELTLTGTSTEKVNGYVWYRVEYKGTTKYVASSLVTSTKPEEEKSDNNYLSSLEIEGITLAPEFSKDVLQYTAQIDDEEITSVEVNAKAEDSKAKVSIEGNENLEDGENTIKVIVTAEDSTTKTYTITVTKGTEEVVETTTPTDNTLKLYELQIGGVDFEDGFNPNLYSYELTLNIAVKSLDITAKANQEDAKIEIVGNQDFVEGQNIVMILLTSADGTESATYQIKVNMPAAATETQSNLQFYMICAGATIAIIFLFIIIIAVRRRKNRDEEFYDEGEVENIVEEDKKVAKIKSEERTSLDEFLDTSEIEVKPRRSRGKHSV